MVLLTIKGTTFPDEFPVEFSVDDSTDTIPLDVPAPPPPPSVEEAKEMEKNNIPIKSPAQVAAEYRRAKNDVTALMKVPGQGVAPLLASLLNRRHYLKLMLLSAGELADEVLQSRGLFDPKSTSKQCSCSPVGTAARTTERVQSYRAFIDSTYALLKDKTHIITVERRQEFDDICAKLRQETIDLFPEWCQPTAPAGGDSGSGSSPAANSHHHHTKNVSVTASGAVVEELSDEAATGEGKTETTEANATTPVTTTILTEEELNQVINTLYSMHENPDLDEDERLVVYHCRLILDDLWREEERELAGEVGVWFAGKLMTGKLSKYGNAKSKLIVRVAKRDGPPPSGEPRMRYDDQRALFQKIREKRETFKNLEESELRDRVVKQSRGQVLLGRSGVGVGLDEGDVRSNVRRIRKAEEREVR